MSKYTKIVINSTTIDEYLDSYDVQIQEVKAAQPNFTAISGKRVENYLGDQRLLMINFEPMNTAQINSLFSAIKAVHQRIPISYIDPQLGEVTKYFTCDNLPAATYFVSDDGIQFWQLPTITFTEVVDYSSYGGSG